MLLNKANKTFDHFSRSTFGIVVIGIEGEIRHRENGWGFFKKMLGDEINQCGIVGEFL